MFDTNRSIEHITVQTRLTPTKTPRSPSVTLPRYPHHICMPVPLNHYSLSYIPAHDLGQSNMSKSERGREMLESGEVKFVVGDGRKGWRDDGGAEEGWDAIHVGAAAIELHKELVEQLRSPGR
jgi:hypothetical protein